jgi:putative DNA primase/helicase
MSIITLTSLVNEPIWLAWRGEPVGDGKINKVPYWDSGVKIVGAKSTDPKTWTSRARASLTLEKLDKSCEHYGVGVVLTKLAEKELWLVGVDLDTCVDGNDMEDWATEPIRKFDSYTEASPSGTGAKIFFLLDTATRDAALAMIRTEGNQDREGTKWSRETGSRHPPAIELFFGKRFFTVTDLKLRGGTEVLRVIDLETLEWLIKVHGPGFEGGKDGNGNGKSGRRADHSQSAAAFRLAIAFHRQGKNYEEWLAAIREDPKTARWYDDWKGEPDGRQFQRAWQRSATPSGPPWQLSGGPLDMAELMLRINFTTTDGWQTLYHYRSGWYKWNGAAYPEIDQQIVRDVAYYFLKDCYVKVYNKQTEQWEKVPYTPNKKRVDEILDALRSAAALPEGVTAPAWLEEVEEGLDPQSIIACPNGLLHIPTGRLLPNSPAFFTQNAIDYAYNPTAPEPTEWFTFLRQLWPQECDNDAIETLQDMFGYLLTPDTSHEKAFMVVGPKRSGKGTIARVLKRLLGGTTNVTAPTLVGLAGTFGMQSLIDKEVAIISDARMGNKGDMAQFVEQFLTITGENDITVNRKHRTAWTGLLRVRFVLLTNLLPRFQDVSGALANRFIILQLTVSFLGREDPTLTNKLLTHLPGILNWAIAGWQRLQARGYFVQPKGSEEAMNILEALGSPINTFIEDCLDVGRFLSVEWDDLFYQWEGWCEDQRMESGDRQTFGRNLHAAMPELKTKQRRTKDRGHVRYVQGIKPRNGGVYRREEATDEPELDEGKSGVPE